jgi:hypothetical protein
MPKVLHKIRLDECSTVDSAANPHAKILLVKRDGAGGEPAPQTREQLLQEAANSYISKVAKSASPLVPASERQQYLERLFAKRSAPVEDTPPAVPMNKAYTRLLAKAEKLAAADPSKSVEQHFAAIGEDPRNAELLHKAIRMTFQQVPDEDEDDDDDVDDAEPSSVDDPMLDPFPANADGVGRPAPTPAEARTSSGRSTTYSGAPYRDGDNVWQDPKPAPMGAVEGSYDPRRLGSKPRPNGPGVTSQEGTNPAVDTRKRLEKIEQRVQRYLAANPTASRVEAHHFAELGKKQRRAYNGALAAPRSR